MKLQDFTGAILGRLHNFSVVRTEELGSNFGRHFRYGDIKSPLHFGTTMIFCWECRGDFRSPA
jgi:hypothetical protein